MVDRPPALFAPLCVIAVALPFLFGVTDAPVSNFWPLLASWLCAAALLAAVALEGGGGSRERWARRLCCGLALAAVLASAIGLVQYMVGDPGLAPFVHASVPGQAVGNLRQRNQQASLLSLGAWAVLWSILHTAPSASRRQSLVNVAAVVALLGTALASAATTSRTGAAQWVLILALLLIWRRSGKGEPLRAAVAGLLFFVAGAWRLPMLLWHLQGVRADVLFERFAADTHACTSRRMLWDNMLTLISARPWLGWGWGELDYAHYITQYPGERFCVLLDNAHNLPLHLAVELGLPAAVALCGGALAWVLHSRPWRETVPARQLAWGVLAIIGLHSLLEYPLWYGPFQVAALAAVALLAWPDGALVSRRAAAAAGMCAALVVAGGALAAWDYFRVSQLYKPRAERAAAYRENTPARVAHSLLFSDELEFARLTTMERTRAQAQRVHGLAQRLLHYSPEPRVIEALIESALQLGRDDEAAFHMVRYRAAYPAEYARWSGARGGVTPAPGTP